MVKWFGFRFGKSAVYRQMICKLPTFGAAFPGEWLVEAFMRWMGVGVRLSPLGESGSRGLTINGSTFFFVEKKINLLENPDRLRAKNMAYSGDGSAGQVKNFREAIMTLQEECACEKVRAPSWRHLRCPHPKLKNLASGAATSRRVPSCPLERETHFSGRRATQR